VILTVGSAAARETDAPPPEVDSPQSTVGDQELAAHVGLRMGGRTTPGGFWFAGRYLYRLSDRFWSETSFHLTVGSDPAACFRDRNDNLLCDHGALEGRSIGLATGVRLALRGKQGFVPYLHGGLGLSYLSFPADDLKGMAVPLILGAGTRVRVADKVAVGGGAEVHLGGTWLNRELGVEPHFSLTVQIGVEFEID
jgi:hypothetical protein